jgi:hypothetical protein
MGGRRSVVPVTPYRSRRGGHVAAANADFYLGRLGARIKGADPGPDPNT